MHAKLELPFEREPETDFDRQWTETPALPERAKTPIIVPERFLYQRGDDSILFSIETLEKLQHALPRKETPLVAAAYAATLKRWGAPPLRAAPLVTTFVPVCIPGPAAPSEKWLWRSTAAAASMLFIFFVATLAVLLTAHY